MRAGISTPVYKLYKFHCDMDWMKRSRVRGVVIWNHICFSLPAEDIPHWLFRHELEHVYQQIRDGRALFYLKYFYYSLRYGYKKNPYEVEAYAKQDLPLTKTEEDALWRLRESSQP
jgi:hypothetical protein